MKRNQEIKTCSYDKKKLRIKDAKFFIFGMSQEGIYLIEVAEWFGY